MAKYIFALALVAVALVARASALEPEQVACQDAMSKLNPCLPYLKRQALEPAPLCCMGVQELNVECALKPDRVKVCKCLQYLAPGYGVDQTRAKSLPALCDVHLPFTISPDMDCNKVFM